MSRTMEIGKARKLVLAITIVGVLIFLGGAAWGIYQYTWPAASGTVTESRASRATGDSRYDNVVYYTYTVNGHAYAGQSTDSDKTSAQTYEKGNSIKVYYNPIVPALSTVLPGRILGTLGQCFCCMFPLLIIVNGILYLPKPKIKQPPAPAQG